MRTILTVIFLVTAHVVFSQLKFYMGFDQSIDKYYPITEKHDATYCIDLLKPQWTEGISGRALDLSENAVLRQPLVVDSLETPGYNKESNLTVQVWVKTLKNAHQGTPIVGNQPDGETKKPGWSIYTQPTGAWGVSLSDGKSSYSYQPNIPRQAINDGEWHQLALSIDRQKGEVWFYLDGKNVAIYNISGLGDLSNKNRTVIGGTDEYWEWGSSGQWTAFNGYIDEVTIENSYKPAEHFQNNFNKFKTPTTPETLISPLRVMVWNIWHGGRRYGKHVGVKRVIETIKKAQPDVVGLIETYGSGEIIADSLGYYFYLISSNLSIMSRFPIKETIKAFRPFNFGGAILDLGNGKQLTLLDTWLHYLPSSGRNVMSGKMTAAELINDEGKTRHTEIKKILEEIDPVISNSNKIPVIMLGDFNTGSHLDWKEESKAIHNNYVVEWPVSVEMQNAGFKDSYRELHINTLLDPGFTWTPRAATSSTKYGLRDRIDYIYYKGDLMPVESKVIDYHPIMFPSDHAAVISVFEFK